MKQVSYTSDETFFVAGRDIEDARVRMKERGYEETPRRAWNDLEYWDRAENFAEFDVFEFRVTEKVTKVEPPYSS